MKISDACGDVFFATTKLYNIRNTPYQMKNRAEGVLNNISQDEKV